MKITFSFDDIEFKDFQSPDGRKIKRREFQSLRFTVRVESDPGAGSEIAEPIPFAEPPAAHPEDRDDFSLKCDVVIKRK
jgi:hypothetical protein